MSKFNKTCWESCAFSSSLCGKIFRSIKMYRCFESQSKFTGSIWVHQTACDGCNFGGLYLLHQMLVFNKICWVFFPLKSSYCGKIFMSIQVVLNVWEQFEVQNPGIFGLHWTSVAYFFFIQCLFLIKKFGKVAHTSLVCVAKFHINPRRYEWLRSILTPHRLKSKHL